MTFIRAVLAAKQLKIQVGKGAVINLKDIAQISSTGKSLHFMTNLRIKWIQYQRLEKQAG